MLTNCADPMIAAGILRHRKNAIRAAPYFGPGRLLRVQRKKQKRQGQKAPKGGAAAARNKRLNRDAVEGDLEDQPDEDQETEQASSGAYQRRVEQEASNWGEQLLHARDTFRGKPQLLACHAARQQQVLLQCQQELLDEGWRAHECPLSQCSLAADLQSAGLVRIDKVTAEFVSPDCRGSIELPSWRCTHCAASFSANFVSLGLWPSSPVSPAYIFSNQLMELYVKLERGGTSMTGVHPAL